MSLKRIDYLSVNADFEYRIGSRSLPFIGIYASYRIGTEGKITINEKTTLGEIQKDNTKIVNYKDGVSPYDVRLTLGYNYRVYRSMEVGVQYFFGLNKILKDDRFLNGGFNNNSYFSIDLKYKIGR